MQHRAKKKVLGELFLNVFFEKKNTPDGSDLVRKRHYDFGLDCNFKAPIPTEIQHTCPKWGHFLEGDA